MYYKGSQLDTIQHTQKILALICGTTTMMKLRADKNLRRKILAMHIYFFTVGKGPI